jgi:uncharacterized protein YcbK (DUF882 family)
MRRRFVFGATAACATLILPGRAQANAARRITLRHAGSGARFSGTWHNGRTVDRVAMAELSLALADPGCDHAKLFDEQAVAIAWELVQRTRFDTELDINSGFRTPLVNRSANGAGDSQHLQAAALDIGVAAAKMGAVVDMALQLRRGGVGVYRSRGFVHVDSGPLRSWNEDGPAAAATPFTPRGLDMARGAADWVRRPGSPRRIDTRLPNPW